MRLFYSNPECTSGQLVIANFDSQYKILHFHHGGLDRLAKLFEQWNAIKSKSVKDVSLYLKRKYQFKNDRAHRLQFRTSSY